MRFLFATLLLFSTVAGCLIGPAHAGHGGKEAPAIDERALPQEQQENYRVFKRVCSLCHRSEVALRHHADDPSEWEKVVDRMVSNGAKLSKDERTHVLAFLNFVTE